MKKTANKFIILMIFISVIFIFILSGCETVKKYTIDEHMARVSERVQKRYIDSGDYTGFEISKLYEDDDKFNCFLVDLEPQGYFYVVINNEYNSLKRKMGYCAEMYEVAHRNYLAKEWRRYRIITDKEPEPYEGIRWLSDVSYQNDKRDIRWEASMDGIFVYHSDSPYKVAGIKGEKKYLLKQYYNGKAGVCGYMIPAVIRGDKFFNLISMEEFNYISNFDHEQVPCYYMETFKLWKDL